MGKVIIFDTTLRDGEQAAGGSMNLSEKLEIARQLEKLGVDVIEAGFPISSPGDFESVKLIAQEVRGSIICGLARANPSDVDAAWEAIKGAAHPRIHVFVSSSDIHLMHVLKKNRDEVLQLTRNMVARAKNYTDDIEFSPMDASRTEPAYLYQILQVAIEAGATTLNIPDTMGYSIPEEFVNWWSVCTAIMTWAWRWQIAWRQSEKGVGRWSAPSTALGSGRAMLHSRKSSWQSRPAVISST